MASPSSTPGHGTLGGRSCFKCGNDLGPDGMRYLGHDWCRACARSEAEARLRRGVRNSEDSTNGAAVTQPAPIPDLPATMQSLLEALPNGGGRNLRSVVTLASVVGGPVLLIVGLGMVLATPAAMGGPALTVAGAILIGAVVRGR